MNINFATLKHFSSTTAFLAVISLIAVALVPVWSVDIPPFVDYHNHLARQYILVNLPHSDYLKTVYQSDWNATPYLAMDAIIQVLARFMSVEVSGKIFLSLTFLLLALAPMSLNLALYGRVTPIAFLGLLFVHNTTISMGFVQYLFGLGFSMCMLSLWIRLRDGRPWVRLIMFPVLSSLLFFSHLMGFVIYALMIGAYELGRHIEQVRSRIPQASLFLDSSQRLNLVSICIQFSVPLIIFLVYGPSSEITEAIQETSYGGIWRKFELLAGMFSYLIPPYLWTLDSILAIALPIGLILLLAIGRLKISKHMLWPLFAMLILFFVMPVQWLGGWGGDHRLLVAIGVILTGSVRPNAHRGNSWKLGFGLIIVLILIRATAVTAEWRRADNEYAEYLRSFELLPNGSKVYYAFGHAGGKKSFLSPKYFLPCLAVIKRQVFVPYLFTSNTVPGIPLQYKPEYYQLQRLSPGPILVQKQSPKWGAIADKYDYFILGDEHFFDTPVPKHLVSLYSGDRFKIYRK